MTYQYMEYWKDNFTKQGFEGIEISELFKYLKTLEFNTVLEIGSGQGKITRYLRKTLGCTVTGIDIIKGNQWLNEFIKGDITKLELDQYDLILCCNILLHIKPEDFNRLILKLTSSSKKIVILDYYPIKKEPLMNHNFSHDYSQFKLIKRLSDKRVILTI